MKIVYTILFLLLFSPAFLLADSRITIATADGVPLSTPDGNGFHDQVIREAFNRLNMEIEIVHLPAERALINANEGIEQGVYVRVQGLNKVYTNLRRVPEKITDYQFVAFSKYKNIQLKGWNSTHPYDVGIITGWKILEKNITKYNSLLKVKNAQILFNVLVNNKVDLIVYNKLDGFGIIKAQGLKGIYALEPPFVEKEMFLYLNKNKEDLIPQLVMALKSMKADGTFAKIKHKTLTPYLPQ